MNTQTSQFSTFIIPEKKNQPLDLRVTAHKYLYHWPLFLIGLLLALSAAFVYLQIAKPVYEVKATLLIKDEKKTPDQQSALHEIDLLNPSKIVENEIEILKSKQLIGQVVDDLNLYISCQKKKGLSYVDLYQLSPVKLTILKATGNYQNASLSLFVKDKESFFLMMPSGQFKKCFFKNSFKNKFGIWKLQPTKNILVFKNILINIAISEPEQLALTYQKAIDVSLSNKLASTLAISIKDQIPQRGKDILNRLIYNYNAASSLEKLRETKSTLSFLDRRIASLGFELAGAERNIEGFKRSRGLTDLSDDSKISLENMQANDTQLNDVNVQLSVIQGIENYINSANNLGKAPATLGITEPALSSLIEKLSTLQLQRERLLATTPETNPDFESINRQLLTTRTAIKENVNSIKSSLLNTRQKLQSFNDGFASSIRNIPTQERQLISIKRQQSIKENLYTYLLQKREEVSISYASILTNDRIVDQAYAIPLNNTSKPLTYAIAFFLGLAIPASFIFARNRLFDNTIVDAQEIKDTVGLPVIVELPLQKSLNTFVVNSTEITAISEQLRALRTKLYYLYGEKEQGRVTLITSSIAGEGKSFVVSNLGIALASASKKTIILEIDLRKPKISEIFCLPKEKLGLSDFLEGSINLRDIIQSYSSLPNLSIISCGSTSENPSELLEHKRLKELIGNLRDIYDDIIIDSPPVHLVPDAMIISRLTDQVLYIIRQGYTQKNELKFIKELNQQNQLKNMSIVFNGIERIKYGYGYIYDIDYYNSAPRSKKINSVFNDFLGRF